METPYSKQDEAIELGAKALREQALDTSRMTSVLNPTPRRSVVLPVGLATAAACVLGAVVLMTPTKADAGQFDKVKKAVKAQPAIFERVLKPGKTSDVWEVRWETWKDGKKSGVKMPDGEGYYEVVLDGNKVYEKNPAETHFEVELDRSIDIRKVQGDQVGHIELDFVDAELVLAEHEPQTINEILARDGVEFLNIKRGQKKEGRACDVYSVRVGKGSNETLYYVDSKTDLPFLKEELDEAGKVIRRIEIIFPGVIDVDVQFTRLDGIKTAPVVGKFQGKAVVNLRLDESAARVRIVDKTVPKK